MVCHFLKIKKTILLSLLLTTLLICNNLFSDESAGRLIEKKIVIVVPSYNNRESYQQNLDSIFAQKYENYRVIYIDDFSSDGTGDLVEEYIQEKGQKKRVNLIKNKERKLALANRYNSIQLCDDDTIIVDCDGDDMLANPHVLSSINKIYSTNDVWMTWGSYVHQSNGSPGCSKPVSNSVVETNTFRECMWCFSHLRTYYAGLFKKIKREDLVFQGKFFPSATDLAVMYPMLEMAGHRAMFINEKLYIYNDLNPLNLHKVNRQYQILMNMFIVKKPKYKRLNYLFEYPRKSVTDTSLRADPAKLAIVSICFHEVQQFPLETFLTHISFTNRNMMSRNRQDV